ncbi:MAG: hypothetical protein JNM36_02255 [Chitinophagales bacterium]|nr:hypothetical protein [Chitinophagales bacterium]
MISILIVDDDINKASFIISSINTCYKVDITQASNVQEAKEVLQNNQIHLLITDLKMPLRSGEASNENGGKTLVEALYKSKHKINVPIYIVGLSQYENIHHNFSGVWKVWLYDASESDWQKKLRDLIFHIEKINHKIVKEKKETLFVEGITDKDIITLALSLFFDSFINTVTIETRKNSAGSSWVERQLIIWAKTLFKKNDGDYLIAVGLFDNDEAGLASIQAVNKFINIDSAESKTFSTLKLNKNYAHHLKDIYTAGIELPITLEELYSPSCWEYAKQQGWLVDRPVSENLLRHVKKWDKANQSFKEHIRSLNLSEEIGLYLNYKVHGGHKVDLVKYIKSMTKEEQKQVLSAFEPLLKDILKKLKLLK